MSEVSHFFKHLEELVGGIVCDVESKECAHDKCQQTHEITPGGENVSEFVYQQWVLKKVPRQETTDDSASGLWYD